MVERRKFISRVVAMAIALLVATSMFAVFGTDEVSAASYKKPYKVTISSAKSIDYNTAKITWKSAKYAKKYQVYRATSKNGKYKKVYTTTNKSFTTKKLTTGKKYYFKVRAINGDKYGKFSNSVCVTPKLKSSSIVSTSHGETWVKLKFKKVNGATGYQVFRYNTKAKAFARIASVKSLTYTNKGLDSDKSYYYKVRPYRKVGNIYVYGPYSYSKVVKTNKHNHSWSIAYNNDKEIQYKCYCGGVKYHTHIWKGKNDENNELVGWNCSCGKYKSHTHDWKFSGDKYVCDCGAYRSNEHEHDYVPIYGKVDNGYVKTVTKTIEINYCQTCEKYIDTTPEAHLKNHSSGAVSTEYRETKSKVWVFKVEKEVIGYRCDICGEKKGHIHTWEPVYVDGYYGSIQAEETWMFCNACGAEVFNQEYHKQHSLEHFYNGEGLPGFTIDTRLADQKVWVNEKLQTGYSCSCGATR